ncbi:LptF/LptG family permease [Penaeicola halotolerans]|uniref:LptF/LptG family permease n=1 Tax=Penaeicola halotolerans TaxID=2793196 RepID=UPI001CF91343|nr:LptF/LptG family permease [Penaeicola halotolerans]
MFKILDRMIIKDFLKTYVFVVLILISIILVIDFTEKNDDFIQKNVPTAEILMYFLNFGLYMANLLTPITVFIAVVFITSRMAGRTEVVAILSSGVSFWRFLRPYFIASMIIASFSFVLNGWILPNANKGRIAFQATYLEDPYYNDERNKHIKIAEDTYAYIQTYYNNTDIGYVFSLEKIQDNKLLEKLNAERIQWDTTKNSWTVKNWKHRIIKDSTEIFRTGNSMDTVLSITPADFGNSKGLWETLTLPGLTDHIQLLKSRGADDVNIYIIEKYIRYMSPFAAIVLTFIGVIVSARKTRGGSGYQIALGFMLSFIYIILFLLTKTFAETGSTSPILAVWMPNIIFLVIGGIMYRTVPR